MIRLAAIFPLIAAAFFISNQEARGDTIAYATAQASATSSVFGTLDLNTGTFTQIATLNNIFVPDLALSTTGKLYLLTVPFTGSGPAEFGTINTSTGAIADIAPNTVGLNSIAFSPSGTLYGTSYNPPNPESLYTVDPATGATSFIAALNAPLATSADDIRFLGNTMYTTTFTAPSDLYTINPSNGSGTLVGLTSLPMNNSIGAVDNGMLIAFGAVGSGGRLYSINPATGATTPGAATDRVYNFAAVATPEPGSLPLVGLGLGAALLLWRRGTRRRPDAIM